MMCPEVCSECTRRANLLLQFGINDQVWETEVFMDCRGISSSAQTHAAVSPQ